MRKIILSLLVLASFLALGITANAYPCNGPSSTVTGTPSYVKMGDDGEWGVLIIDGNYYYDFTGGLLIKRLYGTVAGQTVSFTTDSFGQICQPAYTSVGSPE